MNFTWFASAYDNDDALYLIVTLVTRLPMATQWLRAARAATDAERTMALRYAGGVPLCLVGWLGLGLVLLPESARPWLFLVMALAELAVPVYAEKSFATSWHPHHISELVIVCTFLSDWAVLVAGLLSALAVATGVTLTARTVGREYRERRADDAETA